MLSICCIKIINDGIKYKQIEINLQRLSIIKPFIDQYNWKNIDFLSQKRSEKFDKIASQLLLISY